MASFNLAERAAETSKTLVDRMLKELKKAGGRGGSVECFEHEGIHTIVIENNLGLFSLNMQELVERHPHAKFVSREEHAGRFDWAADVYIKDASSVSHLLRRYT